MEQVSTNSKRRPGRPCLEYPSNWEDVYTRWINQEITGVQARKLLNLRKTSFYNLVNTYKGFH